MPILRRCAQNCYQAGDLHVREPVSNILDTLVGRLAEQGLAWRGAFYSEPDDKVPDFADGTPALTVCLFGWTGGEQWPVFARSPEANDGFPDPLNRWSKRLLDAAAERLNAIAFYPFGGPPWLDFQRWALKAEPVHRSPLGLLIHSKWGLWHSYRGALGLRQRLELAPRESSAHPCEDCRDRPCLSACPVSAFVPDRPYDHVACRQYLVAGGGDCVTMACGARRACPIGPDMRHSEQQATFHIRAFLGNRLG
jgi:hypothetical protein